MENQMLESYHEVTKLIEDTVLSDAIVGEEGH